MGLHTAQGQMEVYTFRICDGSKSDIFSPSYKFERVVFLPLTLTPLGTVGGGDVDEWEVLINSPKEESH